MALLVNCLSVDLMKLVLMGRVFNILVLLDLDTVLGKLKQN